MERLAWLAIGVLLCFLAACAGVKPSTKGALVTVYRANPVKEGIICSTQGEQGIAYMYVGRETVSGRIGKEDKRIIAQYARSVLGQTNFINPISVPAMNGEYPDLSIRVHNFSVKTVTLDNRVKMNGVFQASFSIRQAGMLECSTSDPILIEKHYEMPIYKREMLPSTLKVKKSMVREAVSQVVRQFVPVKSSVLRPVKMGEGDLAVKAAQMIDSGNCRGGYEMAKPAASNPNCRNADLLYNAGVAIECMAWSIAHDQKIQERYLTKAGEYYRRAAMLKPEDADMQKAMSEVLYELDTFFASFKRQQTTGKALDPYKAPTGY